MKDLKNLKGAKMLSKNEQINIKGGFSKMCDIYGSDCYEYYMCHWSVFDYFGNPVSGYCVPAT